MVGEGATRGVNAAAQRARHERRPPRASTTTFTIELILSQLKLRVTVLDGSPTPPVMHDRSPAGGHGMWLVTAMADRSGSARHDTGKQVWFELHR